MEEEDIGFEEFVNIHERGFGIPLGERIFDDTAYIVSKSTAEKLNGNEEEPPQNCHQYNYREANLSTSPIDQQTNFRCISEPSVMAQQSKFLEHFRSTNTPSLVTIIVGKHRDHEKQEIRKSKYRYVGVARWKEKFDGSIENMFLREVHCRRTRKDSNTLQGDYTTILCNKEIVILMENFDEKRMVLVNLILVRENDNNIMSCMAQKIDWVYNECDGFTRAREELLEYYRDQCIDKGEIDKADEVAKSLSDFKFEKGTTFVCNDMKYDAERKVYVVKFFDAKHQLSRNDTWVSYQKGILHKVCALLEYLWVYIILPLHPASDPGVVFFKTKKGKIVSYFTRIACAGYSYLFDSFPILWGIKNGKLYQIGTWDDKNDELDSPFEFEDEDFDDHSDLELFSDIDSIMGEISDEESSEIQSQSSEAQSSCKLNSMNSISVSSISTSPNSISVSPNSISVSSISISPSNESVPSTYSHHKGLRNLGNTCYLNSSLQVLFSLPNFLQDVYQICMEYGTFRIPICSKLLEVGKKLDLLPYPANESSSDESFIFDGKSEESSVDPSALNDLIEQSIPDFQVNRQQDAQEFLHKFIGILHEELVNATEGTRTKDSLPTSQFSLEKRETIKCEKCSYTTSTCLIESPKWFILDVSNEDNDEWSVQESFSKYFNTFERLEDYTCSQCNGKSCSTRHTTIVSPPKVLLVQLNLINREQS